AYLGGALGELFGTGKGREHLRNVVQQRRNAVALALGLFLALLGLDGFPLVLSVAGTVGGNVTKDMRMPPDELFCNREDHVANVEMPSLLSHLSMIDWLQQQIAEFFAQIREILAFDRVS